MFRIKFADDTIQSRTLKHVLEDFYWYSIETFQAFHDLDVNGEFDEKCYKKLYEEILCPIDLNFEDFYNSKYKKRQIVWHHSAGWDNARGMFKSWNRDSRGTVATAIGITDDGKIYRGFDETKWAHHLGVKRATFQSNGVTHMDNIQLNKHSVGVEICNAGKLEKVGVRYMTWFKHYLDISKVSVLPDSFRGSRYYEKYTAREINTLKYWTLLMSIRFNIPLDYRHEDMFPHKESKRALSGAPGLFTHCSFRKDKTDAHPQKELIEMARSLKKYQL